VAYRDLQSKLRARLATESVLVWQRVRQACSSDGARRRDGHSSSTHGDDYRQAELVRVLLRCLTGGGVRRWEEETDLFEQVVLRHTNVAVVLGIPPTRAPARALLTIEARSTLTAARARARSHAHVPSHHAQRASTTSWTMETTPTCCSSFPTITTSKCARP
jgi:hypothetical protein